MITRILKISALFIAFIFVVGISAYFTLTTIIKSEDTVVVPDLVGKDVVYALRILTDLGLNTKVKGSEYSSDIPKDYVIFQQPEPGMEIKKGRDVRMILSKGAETILMPNLVGLSVQQASIILEENSLCREELSNTYNENIKKDDIIAHTPSTGDMIRRGKCVDLLISMGMRPKAYKMPDLRGLSFEDAIIVAERSNLLLGEIKSFYYKNKPKNAIINQEPLAGLRVIEGTIINIVINRKPGGNDRKFLHAKRMSGLLRYRVESGFLKKRIRVQLNLSGISNDLFDEFVRPGEEVWLLIPTNDDTTVFLYEDEELVKTIVY